MKLAMPGAAEAAALLEKAGLHATSPRAFESNALWDYADGRLRANKEVLRIREYRQSTILTFKGAPRDGLHKVREEVEVRVEEAGPLRIIFERLGMSPRYRYEKYRTEYRATSGGGMATVDETPIGVFVELEGAPDWIDETAGLLGKGPSDYILSSYATLWQEHAARVGRSAEAGMVFETTKGQGVLPIPENKYT